MKILIMKEKTMRLEDEMLMGIAGGFDDMDFDPGDFDDDEGPGGW